MDTKKIITIALVGFAAGHPYLNSEVGGLSAKLISPLVATANSSASVSSVSNTPPNMVTGQPGNKISVVKPGVETVARST